MRPSHNVRLGLGTRAGTSSNSDAIEPSERRTEQRDFGRSYSTGRTLQGKEFLESNGQTVRRVLGDARLIALIAALASATAAGQPAVPSRPDQSTLPVPPIVQAGPGFLPIELVGIDTNSGADLGERRHLVLDPTRPAVLTLYLRPTGPMPQQADLVLRLVARPASFGRETTVPLDSANWAIGGAYPVKVELPTNDMRYSGLATLRIALTLDDSEPTLIYMQPVQLAPLVRPSRLNTAEIEAYFGEGAVRLNTFVRLGPGGDLTLPIDVPTGRSLAAVGIVSALAGDPTIADSDRVCSITLNGEESRPVYRARAEAGIHTAIADHDVYPKDVIRHARARIYSSYETGATNTRTGEPAENHLYGARLELMPLQRSESQPESLADPVSIRLQYLPKRGIIEIHEIVLVPLPDSEP